MPISSTPPTRRARRGPLIRWFDPQDPDCDIAARMEKALGLTPSFQGTRDLVDRMGELLEGVDQLEGCEVAAGWQRVCRRIQDHADFARLPSLGTTGRAGNPLGGQFGQFPIPAMLLQPSPAPARAFGLVRLFLLGLAEGPQAFAAAMADQVRLLIDPSEKYEGVLVRLPELDPEADAGSALGKALTELESENLPGPEQELLRVLRQLQGGVPRRRPRRPSPPREQASPARKPRIARSDYRPERPPNGGRIRDTAILDADPETGEAPERVQVYESPEPTKQGPQSFRDVDADARESRHWISSLEQLVPDDTRRLTELERERLVAYLCKHLASPRAPDPAAVILGLMYVTGQLLDAVLAFTLGSHGDLDTQGFYRKAVSLPQDAYRPPRQLKDLFEPTGDILKLPMPDLLASWLRQSRVVGTQPLLSVLHLTERAARTLVEQALARLRDRGRYGRLRQERIPTALSLELALSQRSTAVTYLVAGRVTHAAPIGLYYLAPPADDLIGIYVEAQQRLMEHA